MGGSTDKKSCRLTIAFIRGFKKILRNGDRRKRMENRKEMLCYYDVSYSSPLSMEIYQLRLYIAGLRHQNMLMIIIICAPECRGRQVPCS